jgi:hypothetical protein
MDELKSRTDIVQFELRPELHPILKGILSVLAWGASTNRFLVQHQ